MSSSTSKKQRKEITKNETKIMKHKEKTKLTFGNNNNNNYEDKMVESRLRIAKEIVATEKSYCNTLSLILSVNLSIYKTHNKQTTHK